MVSTPVLAAQQRQRDDGRPGRDVARLPPGPYSATSPQNSWPKTTGWSERPKRS